MWQLAHLEATLERRITATSLFERVLATDPDRVEALVHLAHLDAAQGWLDLAHARLAGRKDLPGWWEQTRQDRLQAVRRQRERLIALESQPPPAGFDDRLAIAASRLALGHLPACAQALRQLAAERPHSPEMAVLEAKLVLRQNGLPAAIALLRGLPEPVIADAGVRLMLARLLHEAGDADGVARLLGTASGDASPAALHLLTLSSFAAGDTPAFLDASARWLTACGHQTPACIFAIAAARQRGDVLAHSSQPPGPIRPDDTRPLLLQFWHSTEVPDDVAECMASWPHHTPSLAQRIMNAAESRAYLAAHAPPEVLRCFNEARHPAAQSDIIRLAVLAREGGIYVDADERCRESIAPLLAALDQVAFIGWLSTETPPYLFNGLLACRPGCPIIGDALAELVALRARHRAAGIRSDIWQVSGPGLITRAVGRAAARPENTRKIMLLTDREWRDFATTDDTLAYKRGPGGNWRLA